MEQGAPVRIGVHGSCMTQDCFSPRFNPGCREQYDKVVAGNLTSMISLMSPAIDVDWRPLGDMSEFDRWNVQSDLSREFLTLIGHEQPDYLVVDFFADIHFGVLRLEDGRYLTDNRWKTHKTDFYLRLCEQGGFTRLTIQQNPLEYLTLWRDAWDQFVAHLKAVTPHTVLVVHRGRNALQVILDPDEPPVPMRRHRPNLFPLDEELSNKLWQDLDDYAVHSGGCEQIDVTQPEVFSVADHPWGPFYVHYTPDYYHRFLADMTRIHARHSRPEGSAEVGRIAVRRGEQATPDWRLVSSAQSATPLSRV